MMLRHDNLSFEDALSAQRNKHLSEIENFIINHPLSLSNGSWEALEALLSEKRPFPYQITEEHSGEKEVRNERTNEYETQYEPYTTTETRKWGDRIFDHQDILTALHHINIQTEGKNEDQLYLYMKQCMEHLLSTEKTKKADYDAKKSRGGMFHVEDWIENNTKFYQRDWFEKDTEQVCANIQRCIAMALKKQDYELAIKIFEDPRFNSLPLLSTVTVEGKQDNLLHYYLMQAERRKEALNKSYGESVKAHYPERMPELPKEILDRINHFSSKAQKGDICLTLLMCHYTQYHLTQLNTLLSDLGETPYTDVEADIKKHFLASMTAYCDWQQLDKSAFADADDPIMQMMQKRDAEIRKKFVACFQALPIYTANVENIITDIKQFCKDTGLTDHVTNKIINEISTNYLHKFEEIRTAEINAKQIKENERKQLAQESKLGEKEYVQNISTLLNNIQAGLYNLCNNFPTMMRHVKKGKAEPLKKISEIIIEDEGENLPKFTDSAALANYLNKIKDSDLPVSTKLRRICNILEQIHNKTMQLPIHSNKLFPVKSDTATHAKTLLENFVQAMKQGIFSNEYGNRNNTILIENIKRINVSHPFKAGAKEDLKRIRLYGVPEIVEILKIFEKKVPKATKQQLPAQIITRRENK